MYLVGLTTQAAVIGAVAAAAIVYQEPLRAQFGLLPPDAAVHSAVAGLDRRLEALALKVDALTAVVGIPLIDAATAASRAADDTATDPGATTPEPDSSPPPSSETVAQRIDAVEQLVARVEAKVDDVRDAQLFPSRQPPGDATQ